MERLYLITISTGLPQLQSHLIGRANQDSVVDRLLCRATLIKWKHKEIFLFVVDWFHRFQLDNLPVFGVFFLLFFQVQSTFLFPRPIRVLYKNNHLPGLSRFDKGFVRYGRYQLFLFPIFLIHVKNWTTEVSFHAAYSLVDIFFHANFVSLRNLYEILVEEQWSLPPWHKKWEALPVLTNL